MTHKNNNKNNNNNKLNKIIIKTQIINYHLNKINKEEIVDEVNQVVHNKIMIMVDLKNLIIVTIIIIIVIIIIIMRNVHIIEIIIKKDMRHRHQKETNLKIKIKKLIKLLIKIETINKEIIITPTTMVSRKNTSITTIDHMVSVTTIIINTTPTNTIENLNL